MGQYSIAHHNMLSFLLDYFQCLPLRSLFPFLDTSEDCIWKYILNVLKLERECDTCGNTFKPFLLGSCHAHTATKIALCASHMFLSNNCLLFRISLWPFWGTRTYCKAEIIPFLEFLSGSLRILATIISY